MIKAFIFLFASGRMIFAYEYDNTTPRIELIVEPASEPTIKKRAAAVGDTVFINTEPKKGEWFKILEFQH